MHRKILIAAIAMAELVTPTATLSGPSISTQAAAGVNFSAYKTYSWVKASAPVGGNPVAYQQIIADIDSALTQKGYLKTADNGQLSLILTLGAREKTDIQSWGRFGLQTSVYQYTQGQLSLDVFDSKTEQAVWHGQANQTIDPDKPNPSKIDSAIAKLMTQFPATAAPAPQ